MNPSFRLRNCCAGSVLALFAMFSLSACDPIGSAADVAGSAATSHGEILGIASPYDPDITVYRGVPYAAPPVDDLRWQPPQPPTPWQQPLMADRFAASCHQQRHVSTFVWRREDLSLIHI